MANTALIALIAFVISLATSHGGTKYAAESDGASVTEDGDARKFVLTRDTKHKSKEVGNVKAKNPLAKQNAPNVNAEALSAPKGPSAGNSKVIGSDLGFFLAGGHPCAPNGARNTGDRVFFNSSSELQGVLWDGRRRTFFFNLGETNVGTPVVEQNGQLFVGGKQIQLIDSILVLDGEAIRPIDDRIIDIGGKYIMLSDGTFLERIGNDTMVPISEIQRRTRQAGAGATIAAVNFLTSLIQPCLECIKVRSKCSAHSQCCFGLSCSHEGCQQCTRDGGRCKSSEECCNGDSICVAPSSTERKMCLGCSKQNEPCSIQRACCGHENQCITKSGSRMCGRCKLEKDICADDMECCSGTHCVDNKCQRCRRQLMNCGIDADCCAKWPHCVLHKCAKWRNEEGQKCDVDGDCEENFFFCKNNTCTACASAGCICNNRPCVASRPQCCGTGFSCSVEGRCEALCVGPGKPCDNHSECCPGLSGCFAGRCFKQCVQSKQTCTTPGSEFCCEVQMSGNMNCPENGDPCV